MIREMQYRNYSPRTIEIYLISLAKLQNFYNLSPDKISMEQLKDFLHHRITQEKISTSTINQTISAFKIFQEDVLGHDWEQIKIKRPRRELKLPVVLSIDEVEKIISQTLNIKHKALISIAYSTGMRREEVRSMKASDIDSKSMFVKVVQGKGKKDRYTILSVKALELLRQYYKMERPVNFLFENSSKKGKQLSCSTLGKIVKNAAKRAGIKKKVSFHTLRHCFATHMLEKGINIRAIQKFMGHTSIKTTSNYMHIAKIDLGSITSPLDNMDISFNPSYHGK